MSFSRVPGFTSFTFASSMLAVGSAALAQQFVEQQSTRFPQPPLNEYTNQCTVGDIDNDLDLDILWANGGSAGSPLKLRVFINNGSGVFTDETDARTGGATFFARGVELGDVDDDDDLDFAVAQDGQKQPQLWLNNGNGFFTNVTATALPVVLLGSSRAQFADVDNDGDLDLYFTNGGSSMFGTGQGKLFVNNGTGLFTDGTATYMPPGSVSQPLDCIFGDVDGDLDLDLHIGARSGGSKLYVNNGSGTFTDVTAAQLIGGGSPYSYDFGDIDGDGDLDLLGANAGPGLQEQLLRNNGLGFFTNISSQIIPNPGGDDNDSKFFDYDNDGDRDLFVATLGQGFERIYNNNGTGTFTQVAGLITAISDSSLDNKVADFNNDGRYDLITAQGESGSFIDRIYMNLTGPVDTIAPTIVKTEQALDGPEAKVIRTIIYDAHTSDRGFHDKGVFINYAIASGIAGGEVQQVQMKWVGNSEWRGVIPAQPTGEVDYFITATDWAGNLATGPILSYIAGKDPGIPQDLDDDGDVDGFDLAMLLGQWTGAASYKPCPPATQADFNGDCKINGFDLAILLSAWTGRA